ncbi:MAG TPA: cupin domain-containing protein [Thermoanaerobaculia bacterium]|jgi:quercetin dioxygenase-like cupin family protein|nr:cupin domain-containing protein [Thermoanaerobaculia bacterium]
MRSIRVVLVAVACLVFASVGFAQSSKHVIESLKDAKWGPAPPMLPPGAQIQVLGGNPGATGLVSLRLKFPAGYKIPAHSHPTDENVVVVSGDVSFGMGDKLDETRGKTLTSGGFAKMPAGMNHYAYTKGGATIVLYAEGPIEFKYVNPDDDPRNKKK